MIEALHHFIVEFGYLAVAIGCFFEGETSILLGIFAAHRDFLTVQGVVVAAIISTVIGDNLWFHVGRRAGRPALDRRPEWRAKAARVETLVERYGAPVMIGFRFLYGLRYVTPFVLGSLGISPWRFFFLAGIGTLIWANLVAFIGVHLASAVRSALNDIHNVEQALAVVAVVAALITAVVYRLRRQRRNTA